MQAETSAASRSHASGKAPRWAFVNGGLGLGGTTTFLCNLAGELVRCGGRVLVLSLEHDNPHATDFEALNVPVILQDERRYIFEDRMRRTVQALAAFQPHVVVGCVGPGSYEALRYVPQGVTRVLMVQGDHAIHYAGAAPYGPFVDAVVGVSEQIRRALAEMPQFRRIPSHYLTCGVSVPPTFTPRQLIPGLPLRLLYLGRLERGQKRVHLFPEILKGLVKTEIPFVWSIVGDGAEAGFLSQQMKTDRPDQQVRLLGAVPYREVPAILETNDVLLLASDSEGLPLCVLEAMASGVVPVVTDLPSGIRELIDDSNGRRVNADNTPGYAQAIVELYRNPDVLKKLSRNARDTIQREFSTSAMAQRWLAAFPASEAAIEWPRTHFISPPLGMNRLFYFSRLMRPFRRLILRVRHRGR